MLVAEPAKPAVSRRLRLTWGPASSVTGDSATPGASSDGFHIALTPAGAFMPVVIRPGSRQCATAVAAYRIHHAAWSGSAGLPATIRDAGSRHRNIVTMRAASR